MADTSVPQSPNRDNNNADTSLENAFDSRELTDEERWEMECTVFCAFLWRHQKREEMVQHQDGHTEQQTSSSTDQRSFTFDLELSTTETNNEDDDEGDHQHQQHQHQPQQQSEMEMDQKLKLGFTEKYLISNDIKELIKRNDKDLSTLEAVLLECKERMKEYRMDRFELERLVKQQTRLKSMIDAEEIQKFITHKITKKLSLISKLQSQNVRIQTEIRKLHESSKEEESLMRDSSKNGSAGKENGGGVGSDDGPSSGGIGGEEFSAIDLEQLRIQNSQFSQNILEKNQQLLNLKTNSGRTQQNLNTLGEQLKREMDTHSMLQSTMNEKQKLENRMDAELNRVNDDIENQQRLFEMYKDKLSDSQLPEILDYVQQKKELDNLERELENWKRKEEVTLLQYRSAKHFLKMNHFSG